MSFWVLHLVQDSFLERLEAGELELGGENVTVVTLNTAM